MLEERRNIGKVVVRLEEAQGKASFKEETVSKEVERKETGRMDIAIIGYYGQFPRGKDSDRLWTNGLTQFDETKAQSNGSYLKLDLPDEKTVETVFEVLDIDRAAYQTMGHQQQVVFHALAQAIQQAGLSKKELKGSSTGVFVTAGQLSELNGANSSKAEDHAAHMLPARVSFELDLKGPSEIHNASCTSSYLLIHKAIQSMQLRECDQTLVIGINLISEKTADYGGATDLQALLSNTGVMKSFDDAADGIIRSEGVGVVLLKKKTQAERDQNKIYGLVKGTSFVHGGKNLSWEAPNPKGLKAAITSSIEKSGVEVDTIDYIEAHGIANPMADAIELSAISEAYRNHSKAPDKQWYVGSVKPVVGHPELASGMASLIKVLKAFEHRTIPGIAGLGEVTKELASDHSLILPKAPVAWESGVHPRRAALNSYAVGGVNAHIILEEYPGNGKGLSEEVPTLAESESSPASEMKEETQEGSIEGLRAQLLSLAAATFEMDGETMDLKASPIDYDFDSVKVIEFVRRVNEYFGIEVKLGQVLGADDFESMFHLFEQAISASKAFTKDTSAVSAEKLPTIYPLSEGQKGLYYIQVSAPLSVTYNVPIALEMEGEMDVEKLYAIAEWLLEAHPVLRTTFGTDAAGELRQELQSTSGYLARDVKELEKGETFLQAFKTLQGVPFDLSKEVFRLHVRTDQREQKTGILFLIHHIVIDGTSAAIFSSKLMKLLRQQQEGLNLTPLPVDRHYIDFITWEQGYLEDKAALEDLAYWKNKLSGNIEPLALPYDHVREEERGSITGVVQSTWTGEELQRLKATAKSLRVNLSVLLLAAFKVLLYRLTGMENLTVTLPTAGRPKAQYADSIGFYINMLLSFDRISTEESLSTFVERVRRGFTSDIDHLRYPYPKLLTELKLIQGDEEDRFPASFVYQNIFDRILKEETANGIALLEGIDQEITGAYTLEVMDVRDRLIMKLKYRRDCFLEESVHRHLGYYEQILTTIISDTTITIQDIELLSEEEKHQLLHTFNDTDADYPKEKTLFELFEEQVKHTPENTALIFEEEQWSYEELNKVTNQLGGYLRETYHIQPDDRVGIQLERSAWMVAGILGILKSGAAYVPIDPAYPQDRIAYMIQDSDCKVVLDQQELEQFQLVQQSHSEKNLPVISLPHHLAYVIYTSGSTGKPKGVMVEHRSLSNLITDRITAYEVNEEEIILGFASICFDSSVGQIFIPFISGASYLVMKKEQLIQENFDHFLQYCKVTHLHVTPSFLSKFEPRKISKLKRIVLVGEPSSLELVNAWSALTTIYNVYGPTEACVSTTSHKITSRENTVSIGKPISNIKTYILDSNMQLVPVGVPGELCIAGVGLARGYLNRPELTTEKFVKNPFGEGRLYRTGDLARWLPNGNIEFLGRIDHQVKIRGYRIELGEIEAVLNSYENLQHAVVIAKEHAGSKQLVAYCVPKNENEELEVQELKSYLSKSLPEYMIPAFFIFITEIPLTPNGKTDRKALMARELEVTGTSEYVAPSTETEKQLAAIWQEVLGVEKVGIHDNFFELGGDSIKVMQLVNKSTRQNIFIKVKDIFSHQTIKAQSLLKTKAKKLFKESPIPEGDVHLTPVQEYFFGLQGLDYNHFNQSVLLKISKDWTSDEIQVAFSKLIAHHDSLRLRYRLEQGSWKQYYTPLEENEVVLNTFNLKKFSRNLSNQITKICDQTQQSLDITTGPVIRIDHLLLNKSEPQNRLFICLHHLVVDGVSWRILLEDLIFLLALKAEVLPSKTTSYQYWSASLKRYSTSSKLLKESSYWRALVKQQEPSFKLIDEAKEQPRRVTITLPKEVDQQLTGLCHQAYDTQINDLLLTALYEAYQKWTKRSIMSLLLEGHGREDLFEEVDINRTVGWFTSIFPVVIQLEMSSTLAEKIKQVKAIMNKLPAKGIGYGILKYLSRDGSLLEGTEGELVFNYLGSLELNNTNVVSIADESMGSSHSPSYKSRCLAINGYSDSKGLHFVFEASYALNSDLDLEDFARLYENALSEVVAHCMARIEGSPELATSQGNLQLLKQGAKDQIIVLLPGKYGTLIDYMSLVHSLSDDFTIYGLDLTKGTQDYRSIEQMATGCMDELLSIPSKSTPSIIGHSFGAILMHEIGCQMVQQEKLPVLINLDQEATYRKNISGAVDDVDMFDAFKFLVSDYYGPTIDFDVDGVWEELLKLDSNESRVTYLQQTIADEEFLALINRLMSPDELSRHNTALMDSYELKSNKSAKLYLIKSKGSQREGNEEDWGWHGYYQEVAHFVVEGHHFSMYKGENSIGLSHKINKIVENGTL
ncbi:MAG: amino acid adenylation domain-containing protein [Bacteroidota bacterium]